mmetsp:Transcript_46344/g.129196  ORF Transcript_46344/g.129196 Transcript_46344/m.129196 type:complete len:85 (+) Transcript_46344:15-269(+)
MLIGESECNLEARPRFQLLASRYGAALVKTTALEFMAAGVDEIDMVVSFVATRLEASEYDALHHSSGEDGSPCRRRCAVACRAA